MSVLDVRRGGSRLRLLVVAAVLAALAYVAPVGPDTTKPAGAWGSAPSMECGASGWSGKLWSSWVGSTTGSTCGANWVRFRSWGFYGEWVGSEGNPAVVTDLDPTWWGGADHSACIICANYST